VGFSGKSKKHHWKWCCTGPGGFKKEIEGLGKFNIVVNQNLYISKKATIIIPSHKLLDAAYEKSRGDKKIGSTLKGLDPPIRIK
jgi:adenylosuccinate synthase